MAAPRAVDGGAVTRRGGLGRGLDALLPPTGDDGLQTREQGDPRSAQIDDISPNPRQPRRDFIEEELQELTDSIAELGILQPLLVRRADQGFELIAGERRLRAASRAGLQEVPILVVETDDTGSLERALVENLHRSDLNPIEEAAALRQLIDESGLTQEALAARLGRNRVTVTNALRLLDLPVEAQSLLISGRLTAGHGRALLGLQGNPLQQRLARRAADESMSVREVEDLVRRYQAISAAATTTTTERSPQRSARASEAQRRLSEHLQTRVRVERGKRKGKIVVDFVSDEELERLTKIMTGESEGATTNTVTLD